MAQELALTKEKKVLLSVESNVDPIKNLYHCIALLREHPDITLHAVSSVWETIAVGSDGPNFLNAAISCGTFLDVTTLQSKLLRPLETYLGRVRTADKNAPRTIDVDVEVYDNRILDPSSWIYAHVLVPLAELAPKICHPSSGKTIAQLAARSRKTVWIGQRDDVDLRSSLECYTKYRQCVKVAANKSALLPLSDKCILVTGGAHRVGRIFALACARSGADVILHHCTSVDAALSVCKEIIAIGRNAWPIYCDFSQPESVASFFSEICRLYKPTGLVNSAAIFESIGLGDTKLSAWNRHMNINLTAPFVLTQQFVSHCNSAGISGKVVNVVDWRALRPGADHLPYSVTKAALVALTKSAAVSAGPSVIVNALALGAVLPPIGRSVADLDSIVGGTPALRWCNESEVSEALLFLLDGPKFITGEVIHLDGGRHLV